jgi:hypothetical protein
MPLFQLSVRHGRTLDDARGRLGMAVDEARVRFGALVRQVDWSDDRNAVTVTGPGFNLSMRVDDQEVHVSGDVPVLGALLGKSFETGMKQIVQSTFGKPGG